MRGRCVAACKDQAPKHPFRDSNPRPPAVQAIAVSTELWPDFSFSPAFVHNRIARRLVEGEESPKVSSASAPKNGLKLVQPARDRRGIAESSAAEGRNDVSQRKTGGRPLKLQGSPKKARGQGLALAPVKGAFLSIEIISVLVP